jgi:hypothetical protein
MTIQHIWACVCGEETPCRPEDLRGGAIWECPRCHQVFGCVYKHHGPKVWVKIKDSDVAFHDLLDRNREASEAAHKLSRI